jgi:hypothetical protein
MDMPQPVCGSPELLKSEDWRGGHKLC